MLESFINLVLQLPLGILFAAGLVECFVLFKDRRDAEPAVLWLLFCAAVAGLLCGGIHFLQHGTPDYSVWVALASGLAAVGFWFKRQARNRGVASLKDRFMVPGTYTPVQVPGQVFYILGYRGALFGAFVLTLVGLYFGNVLNGNSTSTNAPTIVQAPAPTPPPAVAVAPTAPVDPNAPAVDPTAPAAPVDPTAPAATGAEVASTTTPSPADPATPAPATPEGTTPPAPTTPEGTTPMPATPGTTPPATAGTPPPTPGTPPAPGTTPPAPGNPATPATPAPGTPTSVPVIAPKPAAVADMRPISRNSTFGSKIRPIIQRYCVTCHGAEKQKGDLRLDTPDFIRNGVNGKPVILAGKPDSSAFYSSITKPLGDDDRMPPKGDGVSPADAALIKKWIMDGADMGDGVSTASSGEASFAVDALGAALQAPPAALIDELKKEGVLVRAISKDGKVLELDFSHSDYASGGIKLERLAPIAGNVNVLDLSRTKITDADMAHLSGMRHLARLILSRTDISDVGLAHLKTCTDLDYINIYQTKVTDAGLKSLEALPKLRKLYAWQSMVTPAGASSLKSKIPGIAINMGE